MHQVNLSTVDLNLLVVLGALLDTRSTTLAGERLALSQPAVSHALGRLRELFGDPLLVRSGRKLVPSQLGESLVPRVKAALSAVQEALSTSLRFEPETSARVFEVAAGDYAASVLVPPLCARLARRAPHVGLFLKGQADESHGPLDRGEAELVLGPKIRPQKAIFSESLFKERFVCLVRKDHPLGKKKLTLDAYCALGHVLVAPRAVSRTGFVDDALRGLGRSRRVAVALPHFLVAPMVVSRTDYVLTVAERVARRLAPELGLRVLPPPVELPGFEIAMHWHLRHDLDPAHQFLRESVRRVAAELGGPGPQEAAPEY